MADHIPFITGDDVCGLVNDLYSDSAFVRVPLDRADRLIPLLHGAKVWLDPCVDGMDDLGSRRIIRDHRNNSERANPWFKFMSRFPYFDSIGDPAGHEKPDAAQVHAFVEAVMQECNRHNPAWITVPQLPLVDGPYRNKINRALAAETGMWKSNSTFPGHLILPLVFTHQDQVNKKTARNPKVQQAERCYHEAQADGFWVVDTNLIDDSGSPTLRNKRFPGVIALHEELNRAITTNTRIAGPYWGLNLVLWARGLVDYPAIGVGTGYQYLMPGTPITRRDKPTVRLALPSLRRRVVREVELKAWLDEATAELAPAHPVCVELSEIKRSYTQLGDSARAKEQVATFYKQWFNSIAAEPRAGRSIALFQDLSAAYALGKSLPPLKHKGTDRRPEAVAESLMLSCL